VGEIASGQRKIVTVDGRSIGVFNVGGEFRAYLNLCPHALAPVCLGRVGGTTLPAAPGTFEWGRDGEILSCPWHGWEFDLLDGHCLTDKKRLYAFEVTLVGDEIVLTV
jgi:3-phenylpropionate/trans-cinnamate dioxygenase ferredoxin subunit